MYKRSKKDDYRKKIEEMIGRSYKRKSSNNIDNYDTNIVDGTNIINDDDDDVANVILTKAVATSIVMIKMTNQILTSFISRSGIPIAIESKVFANYLED